MTSHIIKRLGFVVLRGVIPIMAVCYLLCSNVYADEPPVYDWVATFGDVDYDQSNGVAIDNEGNVYVVGQFSGTVDFDPSGGEDIHTYNGGSWDIFVTRFNPDGSYGETFTIGGNGAESARGIAFDFDGNLILTGEFVGSDFLPGYTIDFDPTPGVDLHTTNGYTDFFVLKLNSDGSYAWTRTIGGPSYDQSWRVESDPNGDIFICGYFMSTVDFDPTEGIDYHTAASVPFGDAFIMKLYADGSYGWARTFGGNSYDEVCGLAPDSYGNVFIAGYFRDSITVDGWGPINTYGDDDIYVAKLGPEGTYIWFYTIGGSYRDIGKDIALDQNDNVVVVGLFSETVDFDPTLGIDTQTSEGGFDIFVVKLTSNGEYMWSYTIGETWNDWGKVVTFDSEGDILVSGLFRYTVDFDPGDGVDLHTSAGGMDVFVTKLRPNGNYVWTLSYGGIGWDDVYGIAVYEHDNYVLVGGFMDPVDFDPGEGEEIRRSNGWVDAYVLKLRKLETPPGGRLGIIRKQAIQ